jgi:hypothetical protein
MKRKQAKKLVLYFRLSKRKQSETDPVSHRFASKRKKNLSETGAPYICHVEIICSVENHLPRRKSIIKSRKGEGDTVN